MLTHIPSPTRRVPDVSGDGRGGDYRFSVVALTPVIVASVLGAVVSRVYLGGTPAFEVPTEFALASAPQLAFYALLAVGTGLLAGSTAAPLTAILIVFEMTGDYGVILPLMLVCVLSYLTADRISGEPLYSAALARQGEEIRHGVDLSVLQSVRVYECYDRDPVVLREATPFPDILGALRESGQLDFPVASEDGRLVGVLSYQQLARALAERELADLLVAADLMMEGPETVTPEDSLLTAIERMSARDLDFIPVVEGEDGDRLAGLLRRADVMETYQAHLMLPA